MMADIVLLDEEFYDFLIVFGSGVDDFRQDLANRQQVHIYSSNSPILAVFMSGLWRLESDLNRQLPA